jgi:hypothetical protein
MSRFQRRAQAAIERRNGGAEVAHQSKSFEQLVGQANREALKPYIDEVMQDASQQILQRLAQAQMQMAAPIQVRLTVLEKIVMEKLGETKESLAERVLQVEDEATGHVKVEDGAQVGDQLRTIGWVKVEEQENYNAPMELTIHSLGKSPRPEVPFQTYKELEEGLVGIKAGETREIVVNLSTGDTTKAYTFKIAVSRVSRPVAQTPSPAPEVANVASANAE